MSDSKSGSKSNLNESNMPLLEDDGTEKAGETPEKEVIEMEGKAEKDDSNEKEKKKKAKKEKVKKEPGPSCIETHSTGLNINNRDEHGINVEIDLDFDSVLAEPTAAQGFEAIWRLSFILFTQTKQWIYKFISAIIAIPLAILWGVVFSLISVLYIWIFRPILKIVELELAIFKRFWVALMGATIGPVCEAVGLLFGRVRVQNTGLVQAA